MFEKNLEQFLIMEDDAIIVAFAIEFISFYMLHSLTEPFKIFVSLSKMMWHTSMQIKVR